MPAVPRRPHKVTQTSIARDLDLSQALVSKVLNGGRRGVDPATYELIWEHARKSGYHPKGMHSSAVAESVAVRQICVVLRAGLNFVEMANFPHTSHVLHGLQSTLAQHRHSTVLLGAEDQLDRETLRQHLGGADAPRGVAVIGEISPRFLDEIRLCTPRVVTVSALYPGLCHAVLSNEDQAVEQLVAHLAEQGHTRFAWIDSFKGSGRYTERLEALRRALTRRDLDLDEADHLTLPPDPGASDDFARRFGEFIRRRNPPTAILCFNGVIARHAHRALSLAGHAVPRDFSLAAVDASRVCRVEHPRITCAAADPEKLGTTAAMLLIEHRGEAAENLTQTVLAAQFFPGETTGPAPRTKKAR